MKNSIAMAFFAILLSSCGNFVHPKGPLSDGGSNLNESGRFEFASLKSAIFDNKAGPHCTTCHSSYDSYSSIRHDLTAISDAINSGQMPKDGPPVSPALRNLLQKWIAAGAPEFAGEAPAPAAPEILAPNWRSISENILQPKCVVCHNPKGQAKFLDLSDRLVLFSERDCPEGRDCGGKKLLDFNKPENSYLLEVISDPEEPMPPVWSKINRLSPLEIKVLSEWIGIGIP